MADKVIAKNPIMPGFYPDPSICAVGEDYYLCNSTFVYFPGLPIMHSKDLAHWEQVGNAMDRHSQLPLLEDEHSRGLFAPTIRYNDGTYYLICTNVTYGGNYIITAKSPEGPWSEPYYLEDADGIDPSLFFDDDGKCYYIGTHPNPDGVKYNGDWFIYIQEIDLSKMSLVGEPHNVWNGALKNCIWPEGPHLYKKDGFYYIMHAEGGTGPEHAECVCRCKDIYGPYENNPKNPIITHRHLGVDYPIKYVGHGDIIETPKGEWYMTMLAVRPLNRFTTMGRETFLAKVTWEEGWPVVNPGVGMLTDTLEIDLPEWDPLTDPNSFTNKNGRKTALPGTDKDYDFANMKVLGDEFLFLRNYPEDMYKLSDKGLGLKLGIDSIKETKSPSFVCIRQQHHHFKVTAKVKASELNSNECAGLVLMQNNLYNLQIVMNADKVKMILVNDGEDKSIGEVYVKDVIDANNELELSILVDGLDTSTSVGDVVLGHADVSNLSTEVAGGFVGCCVGMYASANGQASDKYIDFTNLTYKAM